MKTPFLNSFTILLVITCSAYSSAQSEDSTYVFQLDSLEHDYATDVIGKQLIQNKRDRWKPWMVFDKTTMSYFPSWKVIGSIGFEFDLAEEVTAHMYSFNIDAGSDRLMLGSSIRVASHNPRLEEIGAVQFSYRLSRLFNFSLDMIGKPRMFSLNSGFENIMDINTSLASEDTSTKRVKYLAPSVGIILPFNNRFLTGLEFQRKIGLNEVSESFTDLTLFIGYQIK